jgi:hypothetical protein
VCGINKEESLIEATIVLFFYTNLVTRQARYLDPRVDNKRDLSWSEFVVDTMIAAIVFGDVFKRLLYKSYI